MSKGEPQFNFHMLQLNEELSLAMIFLITTSIKYLDAASINIQKYYKHFIIYGVGATNRNTTRFKNNYPISFIVKNLTID